VRFGISVKSNGLTKYNPIAITRLIISGR